MKKTTQYSDKHGKVLDVGEVPEKRGTPGVTLLEGAYKVPNKDDAAPAPKKEAAVVADVVEAPAEDAPKTEKKKSKKSDDSE